MLVVLQWVRDIPRADRREFPVTFGYAWATEPFGRAALPQIERSNGHVCTACVNRLIFGEEEAKPTLLG